MIRVFIADDHAVVRQGLRYMLSQEADIDVVGEAGNGDQTVEGITASKPDVLLLDLLMPVKGGVETMREVLRRVPGLKVVVLTSYHDDDQIMAALRAGALSYMLKDSEPEAILEGIRAAVRGESLLDSRVAARVVGSIRRGTPVAESLTPREFDVLGRIAQGETNREIALALHVTDETVKTHVSNIISKLGVNDRTQAAVYALRSGLVPIASPEPTQANQ